MSIVDASSIEVFISIAALVYFLGFAPGLLAQSPEQKKWYEQFRGRRRGTERNAKYVAIAPPAWLFGLVWSVLYTLMAVAAFIVRLKGGVYEEERNLWPLTLFWILQLVLAFYTIFFFGLKWRVFGALIVLLGLVGTIVVGWMFQRFSVWAAVFMYITALWCLFALVLSIMILLKSRASVSRKMARGFIEALATNRKQ